MIKACKFCKELLALRARKRQYVLVFLCEKCEAGYHWDTLVDRLENWWLLADLKEKDYMLLISPSRIKGQLPKARLYVKEREASEYGETGVEFDYVANTITPTNLAAKIPTLILFS